MLFLATKHYEFSSLLFFHSLARGAKRVPLRLQPSRTVTLKASGFALSQQNLLGMTQGTWAVTFRESLSGMFCLEFGVGYFG